MSGKRGQERSVGRNTDHRHDYRDYVDIRAEFVDMEGGEHVALFYQDRTEQLRVAAAFVDAALQADKKALYLADENDADQIEQALSAGGIDVTAQIEEGALEIRDASDVYLDGGFDPAEMVQSLQQIAGDAVEAGYSGLAAAGENTWSFRADMQFDEIIDFEVGFEDCCDEIPASTLCQYNLNRFDETEVAKALWTHRYVVYRQRLCRNPHYIPPEEYAAAASPNQNASLMLEQAHELTKNRQDIETQKQHLSVLNRVLRHNIGNDLNVILGRLSMLESSADLDEDERAHLETALRVGERVVDRADKARQVQRIVSNPKLRTVSIGDAIDEVVRDVEATYPDAEITVDHGTRPSAIADRYIRTAIHELLTNAVVHQENEPPAVDVTVSEPTPTTVRIDVCNDGPQIPKPDQRALLEGAETPLRHGSGVGLWLVKWIVDNSSGRLSFPDGDQCRVRIELEASDASSENR